MRYQVVALLPALLAASGCAATRPRSGASEESRARGDRRRAKVGADVSSSDESALDGTHARRLADGTDSLGPHHEGDGEIGHGDIDDGIELPPPDGAPDAARPPHPLARLSKAELEQRLVDDPDSLGSISLGHASGGALWNAVKMPEDERWELVDRPHSWGTKETVDFLVRAIERVHEVHPDTPKLYIGDLSHKRGGRLRPHISHQSGRDADVGFYYKSDARWNRRATKDNLDVARTWTLVRAFVTETDVELILIDRRVQQLLYAHALDVEDDEQWLREIFHGRGPGKGTLIRHARGHATHLHVRFYNPVAQETGRRAYPLMIKRDMVKAPSYFVMHRARKGQTLRWLARRYGTTVRAIRRANRIRGTRIREGRVYKIPRTGGVRQADAPVIVPPRRLPGAPTSESTAEAPDRDEAEIDGGT